MFSGERDTPAEREDLETLAAALKPLSTWHALETLQECREACGGAGFLAENRLVLLRADLDVYVTFEGDNNVLLQLVAKRLLTDYSRKFAGADAGALAQYVAGQVGEVAREPQRAAPVRAERAGLRQHRALGRIRARHRLAARSCSPTACSTMVAELAGRLKNAHRLPKAESAALFNANQNELIEAARAHGELLQWEAFTDGVEAVERPGHQAGADLAARPVRARADREAPGLVPHQRPAVVAAGARDHRLHHDRLLPRIRQHALDLVAAFGFTPEHIGAPIALGGEAERQDEARAWFAERRAAGTLPVEEKSSR